jgi:hypothetical protein
MKRHDNPLPADVKAIFDTPVPEEPKDDWFEKLEYNASFDDIDKFIAEIEARSKENKK